MPAKKPLLLSKESKKNLTRVLDGSINSPLFESINFLDEIKVIHSKEFVELKANKNFSFSSYFIKRIDRFCHLSNSAKGSHLDYFISVNEEKNLSVFIIAKIYTNPTI